VRTQSVSNLGSEIIHGYFTDVEFDPVELEAYRCFAKQVSTILVKVGQTSRCMDNPSVILRKLEDTYRSVMLEEHVPINSFVLSALITGSYYYSTKVYFEVTVLKKFIDLLKNSSTLKKTIIIANLKARIEAKDRYDETSIVKRSLSS
jgi:eukaryotic-like serine/threonine-protein kinase